MIFCLFKMYCQEIYKTQLMFGKTTNQVNLIELFNLKETCQTKALGNENIID